MTEQEWLAASDPTPMLGFLKEKVSIRKRRLFACACFRRIWHLLVDERSREGVEVFERFVDGQATSDEFKKADQSVNAATDDATDAVSEADAAHDEDRSTVGDFALSEALCSAAYGLCYVAEDVPLVANSASCAASAVQEEQKAAVYRKAPDAYSDAERAGEIARVTETTAQTSLIRDIFGNPFGIVSAEPFWLTSTVVAIAQQMYDSRDFSAMPILADALQDAGCNNDDILNHCRGGGPHVRGCWVVDLVLGKE